MNRKLGPQYDNQRKKPPLRQNQLLSPCPMLVSITTEEKAIFPFFFLKKKKAFELPNIFVIRQYVITCSFQCLLLQVLLRRIM